MIFLKGELHIVTNDNEIQKSLPDKKIMLNFVGITNRGIGQWKLKHLLKNAVINVSLFDVKEFCELFVRIQGISKGRDNKVYFKRVLR